MKKFGLLSVLIFFVIFHAAAKCGNGVHAGADLSRDNLKNRSIAFASVTFARDSSPWVESIDCNFKNMSFEINFENWVIYKKISRNFNRYFLWGFGFGAGFENVKNIFSDSRIGAGLNFFSGKNNFMEFYIQTVWALTYGIKIEKSDYKLFIDPLRFPVSGGIRFWF